MKTHRFNFPILIVIMAAGWILTACSSNSSNGGVSGSNAPVSRSYRITVTNVTHNQPISPAAVVMHSEAYVAWRLGEAASAPLELLAKVAKKKATFERKLGAAEMI